jgi:hypothetical protein
MNRSIVGVRAVRRAAVPLAGVALLSGCLASMPVGGSKTAQGQPTALGSFAVASPTLGNAVLAPTACTAGDRELFLGAELSGAGSDLVVRLVVDPLVGPAVRVYSSEAQFDRTFVFRRSECGVFHFSLDSTGWRVNGMNDYRLTLELDCSRPGESIKGSASATHCH